MEGHGRFVFCTVVRYFAHVPSLRYFTKPFSLVYFHLYQQRHEPLPFLLPLMVPAVIKCLL